MDAVMGILRKGVQWVPDLDVDRYREHSLTTDEIIRHGGAFVAESTRHLRRARR